MHQSGEVGMDIGELVLANVWFTEIYNTLSSDKCISSNAITQKTGFLEIFTADKLQCDFWQLRNTALYGFYCI